MKRFLIFFAIISTFSSFAEITRANVTWIDAMVDGAIHDVSTLGFYERNTLVEAQSATFNPAIAGANQLRDNGYIMRASSLRSEASIVVRAIRKGTEMFLHRNIWNPKGEEISSGAIEIGISVPLDDKLNNEIANHRNDTSGGEINYIDPRNHSMVELFDSEIRPEDSLLKVVQEFATRHGLHHDRVKLGLARVLEIETGKYVAIRSVRIDLKEPMKGQPDDNWKVGRILQDTIKFAEPWLPTYPNYDACLGILTNPKGLPSVPPRKYR